MADGKEAERSGGEQLSTPDPGRSSPDPSKSTPDPGRSSPDPSKSTPDPGSPLPDPGRSSPDPGRSSPDQEKAQRLADLIAVTSLAASLPRHRETASELAELRAQFSSLARDVRDLMNALAEQAGSRRRPNVVIISQGDQDAATIAADLISQND